MKLDKEILIRELEKDEKAPHDLLLLADPSRKIVEDYIKRGKCYLAIKEKDIVGVYVLIYTRPHTMELVNIAVNENYQGKGIGKTIVLDAIERVRQLGMKTLEIGTGNSSLGQLGLYQKCGFRIVGIDRDFFIRNYEEEIYENGIQCTDMIRLSIDL
ncbi:GNAT family N-acetyltransferase [Clostridium sp. D2Q-11]|uniref:GNAT family N-acetyltransferase n=1 Tax=Anaeromonas frigoriresistens TaxID=2683708 RepID=A0A942Z6W6_9FIRM|nr:GNAT family N-acetyltransferase [Anaeromonas frigoriresistens]MBS4538911.1 GNAT family N-acetyltransferase [Anaeromonas frigoriresistens]